MFLMLLKYSVLITGNDWKCLKPPKKTVAKVNPFHSNLDLILEEIISCKKGESNTWK